MEIFQTFGINWYLVLAQIVNFLLIFYLLKRFVFKPVFGMLKKRRALIETTVAEAKKAHEAVENAESERKILLKKSKAEAKAIIDEAQKERQEIIAQAQEQAKKQSELAIKDASEEIERETREAEKRLQTKIGGLVKKIITESFTAYLTPSEQKEIIAKTLQHLPK